MNEERRNPEAADEVVRGPDPRSAGGRPRRVVLLAIVTAIAALAMIVFLHLSGGIGPGIHQGG